MHQSLFQPTLWPILHSCSKLYCRQGNGIWFLFPDEPIGLSKGLGLMAPMEAHHTAVLEFDNNVIHSYSEVKYCISSLIRRGVFFFKISQKPRSVLPDETRNFGIVLEGNTPSYARIHETDLDIWDHSRERKPLLNSQLNTVYIRTEISAGGCHLCRADTGLVNYTKPLFCHSYYIFF